MNYKGNKLSGENEPDSTRQGVWVKIAEGVLDIHRGNFYPNNAGLLKKMAHLQPIVIHDSG